MKKIFYSIILLFVCFQIGNASVFTVTNNSGSNIAGSLLAAVNNANANLGPDVINFSISSGFQTIDLTAPLVITDTVYIDGTTQPGYNFGTYSPIIYIKGDLLSGQNILTLNSGSEGSSIRGLIISGCTSIGIEINSDNNNINNCWVGLDSAGTAANTNFEGIVINAASNNDTIGGNGVWDRNVISGNTYGIRIYGFDNVIAGNYVGTDFNGLTAVANTLVAIELNGATNNLIGGSLAYNLVSGNTLGSGVKLVNSSNYNLIKNNIFGLQANLTDSLPNQASIEIYNSKHNLIGGASAFDRNNICSSTYGLIFSSGADSNEVYGNYFGYTPSGNVKRNAENNIYITNSNFIYIGGINSGEGNLLVNVPSQSIRINGVSNDNFIVANLFGTNPSGTAALGLITGTAIQLEDAFYNTIGGNTPVHKNVISNSNLAISIQNAKFVAIENNLIGTDITGNISIPNNGGITLENGSGLNIIRANVISGNTFNGITIDWGAGLDNMIWANKIGTNSAGTSAIPNGGQGVFSAKRCIIGSYQNSDRNVISGNTGRAIWLAAGAGHVVKGNYIGVAADGITPLPNYTGIEVNSDSTTIGGINPGERNIVANSIDEGVIIYPINPVLTTNARILGNTMYNNGVSKSSINIYDASPIAFSPNDDGDIDTAVNRGQNHPEIKCVRLDGTQTNYIVRYILDTEPNKDYILEFVTDSSNAEYGNGKYFIQRKFVNSGPTGFVLDSISVPLNTFINGRKISVSATDTLFYATSEFGKTITPLSSSFISASTLNCSWDKASVQIAPATGGSGYGYTYNFEPGTPEGDFDNYALYLGPGTYTCYVSDAFGCTIPTAPFTITAPPAIVINLSATPSSCGTTTGSVTANVSGGTGPLTYYWNTGDFSPSVSNLTAGRYYFQTSDANGCMLNDAINVVNTDGQSVTLNSITHNNCYGQNNGAIDISVTGGITPYTYIWSNNTVNEDVTNLTAGYYDVVVRDAAGCTAFMNFQINEPLPVDVSLINSIAPSACLASDGSLSVLAMGGTSPYTFQWDAAAGNQTSSFAGGLAAGQYKIIVTDNLGCTDSTIYTLNDLVSPIIVIDSSSNAGCILGGGDGKIYTKAIGNGPFTYSWSNGATTSYVTNLGIGVFGVTVTDAAGCTGTTSKYISGERPGTAQICVLTVDTAINRNVITWNDMVEGIAEYRIFREGTMQGSFNLIGTQLAGTGNTFVDTLADANLGPWRYKVQTRDSCNQISEFTLALKTIRCNVAVQAGGFNVTWDPYSGDNVSFTHYLIYRKLQDSTSWRLIDSVPVNATLSYLDLSSPVPTDTNAYFVEINSGNDCSSTLRLAGGSNNTIMGAIVKSKSNIRTNSVAPNAIKQLETNGLFKLFPNPASSVVHLVLEQTVETAKIELHDITGRLIREWKMSGKQFNISLTDVSAGVYSLTLVSDETTTTKKLVIEK